MPNPFFSAMRGMSYGPNAGGYGMNTNNGNVMSGNGMVPNSNPLLAFMNTLQAFKQNPIQFLMERKMDVSIPREIMNDPDAMLQHLLQTGQRSQSQVNAAYQRIQNGGFNQLWQTNK